MKTKAIKNIKVGDSDDYAKLYENYPTIKMEVKGDEEFAKYLMKPQEQQVRMVRYGEILKK